MSHSQFNSQTTPMIVYPLLAGGNYQGYQPLPGEPLQEKVLLDAPINDHHAAPPLYSEFESYDTVSRSATPLWSAVILQVLTVLAIIPDVLPIILSGRRWGIVSGEIIVLVFVLILCPWLIFQCVAAFRVLGAPRLTAICFWGTIGVLPCTLAFGIVSIFLFSLTGGICCIVIGVIQIPYMIFARIAVNRNIEAVCGPRRGE